METKIMNGSIYYLAACGHWSTRVWYTHLCNCCHQGRLNGR